MDTDALVRRAAAGDDEAHDQLLKCHLRRVLKEE